MSAIHIPSLRGLARLEPQSARTSLTNVGANSTHVVYTCPDDRMAYVAAFGARHEGGTVPTGYDFLVFTGGTIAAYLGAVSPPLGSFLSVAAPRPGWMRPAQSLRLFVSGGDGTTDVSHTYNVIEFDWEDTE